MRTLGRRVAAVGAGLLVLVLAPQVPASAVGATVALTGVGDNAVIVAGSYHLSATATTDAGVEVATSIELVVDGTASETQDCAPAGTTCSVAFGFDTATLTPGDHTLTAVLHTDQSPAAAQALVHLTVAADPVVVVHRPAGPVVGDTVVVVTAQASSALGEKPKEITFTATGPGPEPVKSFDIPCPASVGGACSFDVPWDATGLDGDWTLEATLLTDQGRTATSAPVVVAVGTPSPSVRMGTPASASALKGRVALSATSSTDARLSVYPSTLAILVDGTVLAKRTCAIAVHTCTLRATWDTTLLPAGDHSLKARLTTSASATPQMSDAVPVSVSNPAPRMTFSSPSQGAVVSGSSVTVRVVLSTDPTQSDVPRSAAIYRNGSHSAFDTYLCRRTAHTCTAVFTWNASHTAGLSTFVVKVRTSKDRIAFSSSTTPRKLYAFSGVRLGLSSLRTAYSGQEVTLYGRLVVATTGQAAVGVPVSIVRDPAIGPTVVTRVTTSGTGRFSVTFRARFTTALSVTTVSKRTPLGAIWLGTAHRTVRQPVRAPMSCSAAPTVAAGATGRGSCSVPGLPPGTRVTLQYRAAAGTTWRTLATGSSRSGTVPFSFRFPTKGSYQLRVVVAANAVYTGSVSGAMAVRAT